MTDKKNQKKGSTKSDMERHLITMVVTIILGLVAWVGATLNSFTAFKAEEKIVIVNLSNQIMDIKDQISDAIRDNYTQSDAAKDLNTVTNDLHTVTNRIVKLESQVVLINLKNQELAMSIERANNE